MSQKLNELRFAYKAAQGELEKASREWDALPSASPAARVSLAQEALDTAIEKCDSAKAQIDTHLAAGRHIRVSSEPDMYTEQENSFLRDLYSSQLRNDPLATDRLARHQAFEVEKYAVSTATLGGVIPPQYLVDLYAKASRNGRVFADAVNHQTLPPEGLSLVVPRLTGGLSAAAQATESSAVSTSDPTESDLTVPVCTIAGYSPVSRQTLERGAYSESILFEDLIARYWAAVDVDAINGVGSGGHLKGVLQASGTKSSTTSTATVAAVWPKIADVIQQINTAVGGLGYVADKIVMHPRRWGFFEAALDSNNRPLLGISNNGPYFNAAGDGSAAGYGEVGRMHGLPVLTDANIPSTLGAGTNEDRIVVMASPVVHIWESNPTGAPVTLSVEQQAGTSLQVQLVAYGYCAFTAERYAAAVGIVSGSGLASPSF